MTDETRAPMTVELAARERTGPMRRTSRPAASASGEQAIDAVILESHARVLEDHEQRLRNIEVTLWKVVGAMAASGITGAGLMKVFGG